MDVEWFDSATAFNVEWERETNDRNRALAANHRAQGLTAHSTGARVSVSLVVDLSVSAVRRARSILRYAANLKGVLKEMKWIVVTAFILAMFISSVSTIQAFYCPVPEVPEALQRSGAVFVGEVVEVIEPKTSDPNALLPERFYTIRLKVERAWKGVSGQEIKVLAPTPGYETKPVPNKGDKYLVYAEPAYTKEGYRKDWLIMGNMCNRSMPFSKAGDDIRELEAIVNLCNETNSKALDISALTTLRSNKDQFQEMLSLPLYIITTNDLRSIKEIILGKKEVTDAYRLCSALK
ncbi:MAG TPA: hypothetical protein VFQ47_01535 [Nitrososphaera sp.]|jgi:hypothetical protein|nr:hypothetical protein [Nitrososphaera sp.]